MSIVWLAGWPHCGSTYTRMLLQDVFGLKTYSLYEEEPLNFLFGADAHITRGWAQDEYDRNLQQLRDSDELYIIKTHDLQVDFGPAIFVVRDGRDACLALSHFWKMPLRYIIAGMRCAFGTYSSFYHSWSPLQRPNTTIVYYEDLEADADAVAAELGQFLGMEPKKKFENKFEEGKKQWPQLFNDREGCHKDEFGDFDKAIFWRTHGQVMRELGYA